VRICPDTADRVFQLETMQPWLDLDWMFQEETQQATEVLSGLAAIQEIALAAQPPSSSSPSSSSPSSSSPSSPSLGSAASSKRPAKKNPRR
jgi:hypothetical protein